MQYINQTKQASFKLGTNLSICKYSRIRIFKIRFGSQAIIHNSHPWKIILSFSCIPEKMSTGLKGHAFYIPSISQVLWNGEPFMFLFVLNSDSFVSSSVQITRVRQKQARLRRVGLGGSLGHFLSLNTFQITKKFPHPLHSLLPTPDPSIF